MKTMRLASLAAGFSVAFLLFACGDKNMEEERSAGVVNVEKGAASPLWSPEMEPVDVKEKKVSQTPPVVDEEVPAIETPTVEPEQPDLRKQKKEKKEIAVEKSIDNSSPKSSVTPSPSIEEEVPAEE